MTDLVEFIVIVKNTNGESRGLGSQKFRIPPRIGEIVTLDDEKGIGQAYKVKAVLHPLEPASVAGDLILEHIGTDVEFRMRV